MAHACDPSTLGGRGSRIACGQKFKTSLGNTARPHLRGLEIKKKKMNNVRMALQGKLTVFVANHKKLSF